MSEVKRATQAEYIDGRTIIWAIRSKANWVYIRKDFREWEAHAMANEGVFEDGSVSELHPMRWWENKDFYWHWENDRYKEGDRITTRCWWCSKVIITVCRAGRTRNWCSDIECVRKQKEKEQEQRRRYDACVVVAKKYSLMTPAQQKQFRKQTRNSEEWMQKHIEQLNRDFSTFDWSDHHDVKYFYDECVACGWI